MLVVTFFIVMLSVVMLSAMGSFMALEIYAINTFHVIYHFYQKARVFFIYFPCIGAKSNIL
jgi:hypothetical protein